MLKCSTYKNCELLHYIDCKDYFKREKENIKEIIKSIPKEKLKTVNIIQLNNAKDSNTYVRNKLKDFDELDIPYNLIKPSVDPYALDKVINRDIYNEPTFIQLPIDEKYNLEELKKNFVNEKYDLDAMLPYSDFTPCTAKGIMDMLLSTFDLTGANVLIINRSDIVGKPLAKEMLKANANVTICHSKTREEDLKTYMKNADIIVSGVAHRNFIKPEDVRDGVIIIDVSINFNEEGKMCGDIDIEAFAKEDKYCLITTVPGGVGLLTRLALIKNYLKLLKNKKGVE